MGEDLSILEQVSLYRCRPVELGSLGKVEEASMVTLDSRWLSANLLWHRSSQRRAWINIAMALGTGF